MKKTFLIWNIILIAATLISCVCYYEFGGIELKGLTSFGFVLAGAVNLIYAVRAKAGSLKFPGLMVAGLFFCMIADIVLNISFIPGALIFAIGHLLYFAAYCSVEKFRPKDALPSLVIFAASVMILTLVPMFDFGSLLMEMVCIGYALIISLMAGKAISNFARARSTAGLILVIGCVLFYFSDLMLVFRAFADAPKITDTLCLFSYYPAQCLIAYAIFQFTEQKRKA